MKSKFPSGSTLRRKFLHLIGTGVVGLSSGNPFSATVSIEDWDSETWRAGTHYWRWHRDGELRFHYKDYGEQDFVMVDKFTADGDFERKIVPHMEVTSKEEALQVISRYR